MSLAPSSFSLQPSFYPTCQRSATFPSKSGVAVAKERTKQLIGHLARCNTTCSNEDPTHNVPKEMTTEDGSAKPPSGTVDIDADVEDVKGQLPKYTNPNPVPHPEFIHCMPPEAPTYRKFSVFTAGSIEMGKAVQWQKLMASRLSTLPITVNNPRRGNWDPNATPEAKNEAFNHQVQWELSALEQADVICFFFDVTTKSPVTLLELGLWAASDKVVVCCNKQYWRAGNVEITCKRYDVPLVQNFEELVPMVTEMLERKGMRLDPKGNLIGDNVHVQKPKPVKKSVLEAEISDLKKQVAELQAQLPRA